MFCSDAASFVSWRQSSKCENETPEEPASLKVDGRRDNTIEFAEISVLLMRVWREKKDISNCDMSTFFFQNYLSQSLLRKQ
jgi:hypothetical protein